MLIRQGVNVRNKKNTFYLKLDKDNEVQDTVEESIAVVKIWGENELGLGLISKNISNFLLYDQDGITQLALKTLPFKCQLCIPNNKSSFMHYEIP